MDDSKDLQRRLQIETRTGSATWQPAASFLVPGLTVLYHPDVERIGERAPLSALLAGGEEGLSRAEPSFSQVGPPKDQLREHPLGDPYISRRPVRLAPGSERGSIRLFPGESGTRISVDGQSIGTVHDIPAADVDRGVVLLLANRVVLLLSRLESAPGPTDLPSYGLVGESAPMMRLRQEIRRVADLDVAVLLRGETGTGKELVARALHDAGRRRNRPYLAVNMGAVPPTLAAAELFGAARGAFTGADQKRAGYFSRADSGTLFLDEIGETPAEVQILLLRALETGEIQPVGGGEPQTVDVRLIAATDADLESAAAAGRFRTPLLHRLTGYEIFLPPLRARREDFGRLFLHFLRQELAEVGETGRLAISHEERLWIPAGLVARLAAHDWPGNVRQLRNVVRQLVIAGRDLPEVPMGPAVERLFQDASPVPKEDSGPEIAAVPASPARQAWRRPEDVREDELLAALRANRWRLQPTAAALGISRPSLYDRIDRSPSIRKAVDLGREEIEASFERCGGDLDAMVEELEVSKRGLQRQMKKLGIGG
ncbi:MAG TPA: sigma-54 dependent transcriptional regulator [Thermoanaerobaculia bacterium]|jgi:two-component system nitrogen regulation response regulator GlnG|nr:sigma-54 dependent transcriptional regulator [Thermoanaerobaculia bacterium]